MEFRSTRIIVVHPGDTRQEAAKHILEFYRRTADILRDIQAKRGISRYSDKKAHIRM